MRELGMETLHVESKRGGAFHVTGQNLGKLWRTLKKGRIDTHRNEDTAWPRVGSQGGWRGKGKVRVS